MKKSAYLILILLFLIPSVYGQQEDLSQLYEKVKKALVSVSTFKDGSLQHTGTGIFISSTGKILTANHLVNHSDSIRVKGFDGKQYRIVSVEVVSEEGDMALLQTVALPMQLSAVSLSESVFYEGDPAFSICVNEKGEFLVSEGYVSVIRRFEGVGPGILTAMHLDQNFDGAPLLNNFGEVIGMFSYPLIERFDKFFAVSIKLITENQSYKPKDYTITRVTEQKITDKAELKNQKIIEKEGLNFDSIYIIEPKLKALGDSIKDAWNEYARLDALTDFIPLFVKALKVRGSYYYSFNHLDFMYKLVAPDNSFRLFSWTLRFDDGTYRYYGAIQYNSINLKLLPLYDYSHMIPYDIVEDTILSNESWFGAQYYDIGMFKKGKKKFYVLLGWDGNNYISSKKIIELLTFDENGNAVFGAPVFQDTTRTRTRVVLQYNKDAVVALKLIHSKNLIVFDNLVPPVKDDAGKVWTYLPDGSYNYFKFSKGKFIFHEDVFKNEKITQEDLNESDNISGKPGKKNDSKSGILPPR